MNFKSCWSAGNLVLCLMKTPLLMVEGLLGKCRTGDFIEGFSLGEGLTYRFKINTNSLQELELLRVAKNLDEKTIVE
jgi:hypothetical protein